MMKKLICHFIEIALGGVLGYIIAIIRHQYQISWDWNMIAALAAVIGVIVSSITYWHSVERAKKIETLKELSAIREKYPNVSPKSSEPVSDGEREEYLKTMERFCTGINLGLYDIEVVKKTSGTMLKRQYKRYLKNIIDKRRAKAKEANPEDIYREYEKVINELEKGD